LKRLLTAVGLVFGLALGLAVAPVSAANQGTVKIDGVVIPYTMF
jgi:hypothetical protein